MSSDDTRFTHPTVLIPFSIATLIWGSTWIVIVASQLGKVPASWSIAYRFLIAGVLMLAVAAVRRETLWLDARGWALAAVSGALQFLLNYSFVYEAERHVTSGLVAVVGALQLLPNAVFGRLFLGHRLERRLVLGSGIAMLGIALLLWQEAEMAPSASLWIGVGCALAAVLAASSASVMQGSRRVRSYPPATLLGCAMLAGAAMDVARAWLTNGPPVIDTSPVYLAGLLYLGVIGSALAFTLYYSVIRAIGPARAAYSAVLIPVVAMLLSTLFEGYRWSPLAVSGGALTLAGLVVALGGAKRSR